MAYEEALKESSRSDVLGNPSSFSRPLIFFHILKKVNMSFLFNLLESIINKKIVYEYKYRRKK